MIRIERAPSSCTAIWLSVAAALLAFAGAPAVNSAAELVTLNTRTWDAYVPVGKEVDCIYGDYVLRNDKLVAVVAQPIEGRNANMTVRDAGGAMIDLTVRDRQGDQLSAFYPGARNYKLRLKGFVAVAPRVNRTGNIGRVRIDAPSVTLVCAAEAGEGKPAVEVRYTLEDGDPFILLETTYTNPGDQPLEVDLVDDMRADRTFEQSPEADGTLCWVYDKWFGQAYGIAAEGGTLKRTGGGNLSTIRYSVDGKSKMTLEPGQSHKLVRRVFPGSNLFEIKSIAAALGGTAERPVKITVRDGGGNAVANADVAVRPAASAADAPAYAWGRTFDDGTLSIALPAGEYQASVSAVARGARETALKVPAAGSGAAEAAVELDNPGYVAATISDSDGGPIPCKVEFKGTEGTESPDFGPDSGEHAVKNLYYSENGRFRQVLVPGKYEVLVSHGPEFDAVTQQITVAAGKDTPLQATLVRSVDTTGWVSSDFHSHSTPSGDNTSSQLGRVLNLVCEHIEFAPCTEHNRLSTYLPHIKKLGIEKFMATCTGMELTNSPLPVDHQNAFPLVLKPHTQDGGAPLRDDDPEVQIERLALWDNNSDKLVQENHPDIGWVFYDKNGDGVPDGGFSKMFGYIDVMEVHPPEYILEMKPTFRYANRVYNRTIFNWLQLLNQGHRIPGVVNTDAHYTFHGSGWLRNFIKSPTDDPTQIQTLDIVHAAERGNLVMSNGPFLEVALRVDGDNPKTAIPGDFVTMSGGQGTLHVRVQCPNWFDIDRVQVLLNGRPSEELNFTRADNAEYFSDRTVKFDRDLPLKLAGDAHVIVVAIGEHQKLGPVVGPDHQETRPVAVANPIYVDVDGGGFKANGDTLGAPLPVHGDRPASN